MKAIKNIYTKLNIKQNYIFIIFIIALILAITLLIITFIHSKDQSPYIYSPKMNKPIIINNVFLKSSDGSKAKVTLPVKKYSNHSYSYDFIVKKDINGMQQKLNVNVYYTSFVIKFNDEIIFEKSANKNSIIKSGGSSFNMITIPDKYLDKKLTIEFTSNLPKLKKIIIPEIMIGSENIIRKAHFYKNLSNIFIGFSTFITAIFISMIGLFFIKIGQKTRNLFISVLFAIIMSFYLFFNTWIITYYLNNFLLSYFIEYTCLSLFLIPVFLLYLNNFYQNNYYDWRVISFKLLTIIIFINFIIQSIITILGISEFVLMEKITFSLLVISILFINISIPTINRNRIDTKHYLVFSIIPLNLLIISIILEHYDIFDISMTSIILISIIVFMITIFIIDFKKYIFEYNLAIEDDFFSQLAYFDTLTSLSNRHAFEQSIKDIISKKIKFNNMYLIMMDINNFKKINDNYGHNIGDLYLKETGKFLTKLENKYGNLNVYRYGGDEFIILAFDKKPKELEKIIMDIENLSNENILNEYEYNLEFAIGYSMCNVQDSFEILTLKDQADRNMYNDKKRKKGGSINA